MGLVMNVQRFSLYDGPGIRTTAFLMGCNLRCRWCHNPESWLMARRMMFYQNKCSVCRRCARLCNRGAHVFVDAEHLMNLSRCIECELLDVCVNSCPAGALTVCGKEYTPEELTKLLARDRVFYGHDGGVTFSGGEPLLQDGFLYQCLMLCKEQGLRTCVDTAANVPKEKILRIVEFTDLFLVDLKAMDQQLHRKLCGVGNEDTLANIHMLGKLGKSMWIRIPLVYGENTSECELRSMAKFMCRIPTIERVDLFPVLNHAQDKYRALGLHDEVFNETVNHKELVEMSVRILKKESNRKLNLNQLM